MPALAQSTAQGEAQARKSVEVKSIKSIQYMHNKITSIWAGILNLGVMYEKQTSRQIEQN
jgi:hypothetical protein